MDDQVKAEPQELSDADREDIRGALLHAAMHGHPVAGLAAALIAEFARINTAS